MSGPSEIWIDMQIAPSLAPWLAARLRLPVRHFVDLGYATATDSEVFDAARAARAAVLTKDADFARLVISRGAPPCILWLRSGNATIEATRTLLERTSAAALELIRSGEVLVELIDSLLV